MEDKLYEGDPIEAPPSFYKVEPERQGKLVWISGPPGLGKSTTAQLLSRKHGYVYYEGDCFFMLRNPFIPPNAPEASLASLEQNKLVGAGAKEREEMAVKVVGQFKRIFEGEEVDYQVIEEGVRMICRDIKKERTRIGGDWAVCCVLHTRKMREIVREELGKDLLIICLDMDLEGQMERIRSRHSGNEKIVERMKTVYNLCQPPKPDEINTCKVKIDAGKNPLHVLHMVLEKINTR